MPDLRAPDSTLGYATFRRLTFFSVLAGLCPLIPVPFLDDWVLARVRRWMVRDLAARHGLTPGPDETEILAGGRDPAGSGCSGLGAWLLTQVVIKLLSKLTRKLLFVLALKESADRSVEVFHQGYLLGVVAVGPRARWIETRGGAEAVRRATVSTLASWDLSPVRKVIVGSLSGSAAVLKEGAGLLARAFRRRSRVRDAEASHRRDAEVLEEEERLLGGVTDHLARSLWGDRSYFQKLEERLERALLVAAKGSGAGTTALPRQ